MQATNDTAYTVGTDIAECIMNNIESRVSMKEDFVTMCIPVTKEEVTEKPTSYKNGKVIYIKDCNIAVCPMGEYLIPTTYRKGRGVTIYFRAKVCNHCTQNFVNGTIPYY